MSAFFKPKGTKTSYFSINNPNVRTDSSGWSIELYSPVAISNSKGEPLDSLEISANQKVVINLGTIDNPRYHLLIDSNPELYSYGFVQLEKFRVPGTSSDLLLHFKAERAIDLQSLDWIARLCLVD